MKLPDSHRVVGLVLAAGYSRRLGFPKQSIFWEGQTLLERCVKNLYASGLSEVWVLSNASAELANLAHQVSPNVVVIPDEKNLGMGSTLKQGIQTLQEKSPDCEACLLATCDQIFLNSDDYSSLLNAYFANPGSVVCAAYEETYGIPCILPRTIFADVLTLDNEKGAKRLLHLCDEKLLMHLPHAAVDIDSPEDLRHFSTLPSLRSDFTRNGACTYETVSS